MTDPTLFVCPSASVAVRLRRANPGADALGWRFVDTSPSQLSGVAPKVIIVHPDVDLYARVGGEGRLIEFLKMRQMTWGDQAVFIKL